MIFKQQMKKYVFWKRVFLVLSVLMVMFIFSQSLKSRAVSSGDSEQVLGTVQRLLAWLNLDFETYPLHVFIRKAAHFAEFSALGVCIGGYAVNLGYESGRRYIALPAWLTLCVAVCDEFIQTFSGRAGMVEDVVLDYCGAVFGMLLVLGYITVRHNMREKRDGLH